MIFETAEKTYEIPARSSGILLHPTSLPSSYGIGDLGNEAYQFVDFLEKAGQHLWQILPLGPTGFGDSPYQSFSAFAGQPLLISPKHLEELGLLFFTKPMKTTVIPQIKCFWKNMTLFTKTIAFGLMIMHFLWHVKKHTTDRVGLNGRRNTVPHPKFF